MNASKFFLIALLLGVAITPALLAHGGDDDDDDDNGVDSIPSVVVRITNLSPSRGTFLTPVWIGLHDGTFDSYDGGEAASVPLGGNEIEALAEDGNTGPISDTFSTLTGDAPQATVPGPAGPLAPGESRAITLNVDPLDNRYFSYASMIIPSNDAFVANGNPLAHMLFDDDGEFVGEGFLVSGDESNDAGTEVNDEIASNVAFLAQGGPNIGDDEDGVVVTPHPGFAAPGDLAYPDGILNYPVFANSAISEAGDRLLGVEFRYVDFGDRVRFRSSLSPDQEVQGERVDSEGSGVARLRSKDGNELRVRINFDDLTGDLIAAHLHLGAPGTNGPVIVDLEEGIRSRSVRITVDEDDLTGPLAGADFLTFLNELAAGNVYINLHTAEFPAGEIRGQVDLK